jgi:cell division septation protein DedD
MMNDLSRIPRFTFLVSLLLLFAGACTSKQAAPPPTAAADNTPYNWEQEGKVPPLDLADVRREVDKTDSFEEMPVTEDAVWVEDVEIEEVPPEPPKPDTTVVVADGFRVQVMATANEESARVVQGDAQSKLGVTAYLELIDGVFKVRVGDCWTRAEAEALVRRCRDAGYGDAWIVASEIKQIRYSTQADSTSGS